MRSTPLRAGGLHVGALNLHGNKRATFDHLDITLLDEFAQHAAIALAHVRRVQDLKTALESRTVIGQAQGCLDGTSRDLGGPCHPGSAPLV